MSGSNEFGWNLKFVDKVLGQGNYWGSVTTDLEWLRVVDRGMKRVKLWMGMPSSVGGLGEEWPCTMTGASRRDLVYHASLSGKGLRLQICTWH